MLQYLLHSARQHPLLVVGTIRTEDALSNAPLAAMIEALRHNEQLTELKLGPLSLEETKDLVEQTAGAAITPAMARSLHTTSEGHPLFLVEMVEGGLIDPGSPQVEHRSATQAAKIDGEAVIPPKIYNLIAARLDQLSPMAQQVASAAAVVGRAFTYGVLQAAISVDELPLVDALDELWKRRMIREQADDGYDFSHDRIREVAYRQISRARRRLLHRQVALALETQHAGNLDSVAGELATHFARAGDGEKAYRFYRQAANVALAQRALTQAEASLEAALIHAPDDPVVRIELMQDQNTVFRSSLQFRRWRSNLDQQQELLASLAAPNPHLKLELELSNSQYFATIGDGGRAVDAARIALNVAETLDSAAVLSRSYQELGYAYWVQTRMADASHCFGQSAQYARAAGFRESEAGSLEMQAATGMFSGMAAPRISELLTMAYQAAEEAGNQQRMANVLSKFAYLAIEQGTGDFDLAFRDYRRAVAIAREIGDRWQEELSLSNLGLAFTNMGDYRQAQHALDLATEIGKGRRHYWRSWVTHHYSGRLMMQMGCLDSARVWLANASEQLSRIGNRHFEVRARCDLGLLHHLAGEYRAAQAELAHVMTLVDSHGDLRVEALVSTRLGHALEMLHQPDEARSRYQRGYDLHEQMGQGYYAMNARAGLARMADQQGDDKAALAHAEIVWETIADRAHR